MKILLVSATEAELEPFETIWFRKNQVDRLVSGVGMVATAHSLTRELQSKSYDLAINIGLAGSFDRTFKLADFVAVKEDDYHVIGWVYVTAHHIADAVSQQALFGVIGVVVCDAGVDFGFGA